MGVYDMKLQELLKNLEILECTAPPDTEISGISYDSRVTRAGDLFVAIKGFEVDGHRFIPKAMERGAAAVLCEDAPADGTPYVRTAASVLLLPAVSFSAIPRRK